jgi:D-serine deaminase-like pyridoxal phosphate-dependent protein
LAVIRNLTEPELRYSREKETADLGSASGCDKRGKEKERVETTDWKGASKWSLDTPCLVVDQDKLERNIRTMQAHVEHFEKKLRPHAKTHKCSRIARMQMEAGAVGICVAKVSEAEVLVQCGLKGTLITSPVVTDYKIIRLMECLSLDPELMVVVDNLSNAQKLSDEARRRGLRQNVLLDLDPGMGRTGVPFKDGLSTGQSIASLPGLRLRGVQCYAGHVQHISSFEERLSTSLAWMGEAADVVRHLRGKGLPCEIFTGSGTGTFDIDIRVPDLTDLQAGSYTMMDAEYLSIGSWENPSRFEKFSPALTLLTSVVNTSHEDHVTVDAGLKALYHDGATPYVLTPVSPGLEYSWRGDEHGQISFPPGSARFELGDVVELVVSHCDPTVNLFDFLYVTRKDMVTDVWPVDMRGKCR